MPEIPEGFILLPRDAPPPPNTTFRRNDQLPPRGMPIFCGVGYVEQDLRSPINAVIEQQGSLGDLAANVEFPIYSFQPLPDELSYPEIEVIRHESGELHVVSVTLRPPGAEPGQKVPFAQLWIRAEWPYPYPVRVDDGEQEERPRVEVVDFLPGPGLMKTTLGGYVFYWITQDTLYTLNIEAGLSAEEAQGLASSLVAV